MPIYMDRHFLEGATAVAVYEAHQADIKDQYKYKCKTMTYWFDEPSKNAFCLLEAPNKEAVIDLHRNTHGLIPNQIIEVNKDLVELFLGRITDPKINAKSKKFENVINETGFRTIMYVDNKYPEKINLSSVINKEFNSHKIPNDIIRNSLKNFNGKEVFEHSDGGIIASFGSVSDSIKCALEMKNEIEKYNIKHSSHPIYKGVSLHNGAPVDGGKELFDKTIKQVKWFFNIAQEFQMVFSSSIGNLLKQGKINISGQNKIKILSFSEENFLFKLMDIIENLWDNEKFNITQLGKLIGLSKSQLYRKVSHLTGHSPNEFLREYRLQKALKLLKRKRGNISEITFESGFNNPSYFSKCFQRRFGILPSELSKITI